MKKTGLAALALFFGFIATAQQEISISELDKHIGDSVKVCTKIYGGIYLDRSKGSPTLLNAGGAYPNAPLTILIWDDVRKKFSLGASGKEAPEVFFKDKEICVTGKVILYKEKPEIVIYDEKQLVIKE
ncbi:MAG TPA: hypothetical protein VGO58_16450 [Chitinophagaceae bacterium]|nr:hypothetical protein [Chitinophagaceae bacterium]